LKEAAFRQGGDTQSEGFPGLLGFLSAHGAGAVDDKDEFAFALFGEGELVCEGGREV